MSPRRKQQHRMQHNVSLPAWSDAPELVKDGVLHVSIHVPAWGATTEFLAMRLPTMFQSTFPRGERHTANHGCLFWEMFQSTLPRGERQLKDSYFATAVQFQSTLPRGERPLIDKLQKGDVQCFNPRSRVGSDVVRTERVRTILSFNPRSRVGSDTIPCANSIPG